MLILLAVASAVLFRSVRPYGHAEEDRPAPEEAARHSGEGPAADRATSGDDMFKDTRAFSGFSVDDTDAARTFYADTLGLRVSQDADMAVDKNFMIDGLG